MATPVKRLRGAGARRGSSTDFDNDPVSSATISAFCQCIRKLIHKKWTLKKNEKLF
jgi:hypothetical protein